MNEGVLLIDKCDGLTSFAVVKAVKRLLQIDKVGHTGTLDPIATGLLPICLGRATKLASMIMTYRKVYDVWARFGEATDSHDRTGNRTSEEPWQHLTHDLVQSALPKFHGEITQEPPMFSAVKFKGRPLYWYAHKGIIIGNRKLRRCHIHRFELLDWQPPRARFIIESSHGTYVRTLIHDLARGLGSAAFVESLCRTQCGALHVDQAITLEKLEALPIAKRRARLLSMNAALPEMPNFTISHSLSQRLRSGRTIMWSDLNQETSANTQQGMFKLIDHNGELVAVASFATPGHLRNRVVQPLRIFA